MLGDIIGGGVVAARSPVNVELVVFYPVSYPKESHVNCFRSLELHGIIRKGDSRRVVDLHWCCGLRVAQLF